MKGLRWNKNLQTFVLMVLVMSGMSAGDTIVEGQPELFWKQAASGAVQGAFVFAGIYWAIKRGWIKTAIQRK